MSADPPRARGFVSAGNCRGASSRHRWNSRGGWLRSMQPACDDV